MLKKIEYICVFLSGGIIYSFIEVAWRGYTHWSMTIAGGICFMLIHFINAIVYDRNIFMRAVVGGSVITAVEFVVGVVVNLGLHLDVWDYSDMAGNIAGQVCPLFTVLWFFLAIPAFILSDLIRRFFDSIAEREKNEAKQHQRA